VRGVKKVDLKRKERGGREPVATDLTTYLKGDVAGLTYFWKR
jgi:hypothetical protein